MSNKSLVFYLTFHETFNIEMYRKKKFHLCVYQSTSKYVCLLNSILYWYHMGILFNFETFNRYIQRKILWKKRKSNKHSIKSDVWFITWKSSDNKKMLFWKKNIRKSSWSISWKIPTYPSNIARNVFFVNICISSRESIIRWNISILSKQ